MPSRPALVERVGMDRDRVGVEDRAQPAALFEDMAEVGGEAVGDVDHRVESAAACRARASRDPRLGPEVAAPSRLPPSGPVTRITSPGLAPERRTAPRGGGLAEQRHADHQRAVPGVGVAADQVDLEPVGHPRQSRVQPLGDRDRARPRQGDRDHGGRAARPAIAAMSERFTPSAL